MTEVVDAMMERYVYRLFRMGIFLKGMLSLVEIFAGSTILFISPAIIGGTLINLSQNELAEDPTSFIANHLLSIAQQFALTPRAFIALYLLSRGIIKLALVVALLKNQLWAYPAALIVLGFFIIYQVYEIYVGHSAFLIALTLFDMIIMWLIWHEYRVVRAHFSLSSITQ